MKILVVDDHALVREGLRQVLRGLDESVQVLLAGNCEQAFAHAREHSDIDLALLDHHLPDMSGLQALFVFGEEHPDLPVLMLSGSGNLDIVREVMRAGAAGFVNKSSLSEDLLKAVRCVLDGGIYYPPELSQSSTSPSPQYAAEEKKAPLTQRQRMILQGLQEGLSNREIALKNHVSEETVKSHVTAIFRYFDVQNRTQAVMAAARHGYLL